MRLSETNRSWLPITTAKYRPGSRQRSEYGCGDECEGNDHPRYPGGRNEAGDNYYEEEAAEIVVNKRGR